MATAGASVIILYVEAAKNLLRDLDDQAQEAMSTLSHDHTELLGVVERRGRMLDELGRLIGLITASRRQAGAPVRVSQAALEDLARASAAALESHLALIAAAQEERNRLSHVGGRLGRPDAVARQYSATTPSSHLISVSG